MKKLICVLFIALAAFISGCVSGVSQEKYENVKDELKQRSATVDNLQKNRNELWAEVSNYRATATAVQNTPTATPTCTPTPIPPDYCQALIQEGLPLTQKVIKVTYDNTYQREDEVDTCYLFSQMFVRAKEVQEKGKIYEYSDQKRLIDIGTHLILNYMGNNNLIQYLEYFYQVGKVLLPFAKFYLGKEVVEVEYQYLIAAVADADSNTTLAIIYARTFAAAVTNDDPDMFNNTLGETKAALYRGKVNHPVEYAFFLNLASLIYEGKLRFQEKLTDLPPFYDEQKKFLLDKAK